MDFLAETIKSILKDTTPAGDAMLKQYEVKSEDIKQKQEILPDENRQKSPDNITNPQKQETMEEEYII